MKQRCPPRHLTELFLLAGKADNQEYLHLIENDHENQIKICVQTQSIVCASEISQCCMKIESGDTAEKVPADTVIREVGSVPQAWASAYGTRSVLAAFPRKLALSLSKERGNEKVGDGRIRQQWCPEIIFQEACA